MTGILKQLAMGNSSSAAKVDARLAREVARSYADRASQIGGDGRDGVVDMVLFGHAATPSVRCDQRYTRRPTAGQRSGRSGANEHRSLAGP